MVKLKLSLTVLWRSLALVLAIAVSSLASATELKRICQILSLNMYESVHGTSGAVEMELFWTDAVANIITTTTGKVGPIFEGLKPEKFNVPDSVKSVASSKEAMLELAFDSLSGIQKQDLIREANAVRGQAFFTSRRIKGLSIVKNFEVELPRAFQLNGVVYGPGRVKLPLAELFSDKIEFMGPTDPADFGGVELHVRQSRQAGDVSIDAVRLARILKLPSTDQHVHMIATLDMQQMRTEPNLAVAKNSFLFRDANLFSEMVDIVENYVELKKVATSEAVYFDSLNAERMLGVASYFADVAAGRSPKIASKFKMGWVGFRGLDFYQGDGLFGLEWRAIAPDSAPSTTYRVILNNAHRIMASGGYTTPKEILANWLSEGGSGQPLPKRIQDTWYNQDATYFATHANAFAKKYEQEHPGFLASFDQKVLKQGNQIKMLLFDWSNDPLVKSDPALLKRINLAQQNIFAYGDPTTFSLLIPAFLYNTGLYAKYANVFGVPMTRPSSTTDAFWKDVVSIQN